MKHSLLVTASIGALTFAFPAWAITAHADNGSTSAAAGKVAAANGAATYTDSSTEDESDNSAANAGTVGANNGGTATDNTDNSTYTKTITRTETQDKSVTAGTVGASSGGTATDNTDNSTYTKTITKTEDKSVTAGTVGASNGATATDNTDNSVDNSVESYARAHTDAEGSAATANSFGNNAVVSSANLSSYVTGVSVDYRLWGGDGGDGGRGGSGGDANNHTDGKGADTGTGGTGGAGGAGGAGAAGGTGGTVDNSMTTGDAAFQNFAGLQSLNMNTGVGASQNAAVNVAVSAGDINLGSPN